MTSMINERQLDSFLTMKFNGKDVPQQWFTRSEVKRVIKIALSAVKEDEQCAVCFADAPHSGSCSGPHDSRSLCRKSNE